MLHNYEVLPYSYHTLIELLAKHSRADIEMVRSKSHASYFESYFAAIETSTIVVEGSYVDRDYLEDYSGYYVRCFRDYRRQCTRLHFFKQPFDRAELEAVLDRSIPGAAAKQIQESYQGFVVVKPLPRTIIGRTCLVTYPDEKTRRFFPIARNYKANLFGIPLSVETLAFQEQDQVVSACATSALWAVLQGTGMLFHHHIPSPFEITQIATRHEPIQGRALPNSGLTLEQMAYAIRTVGLEPILIQVEDEFTLQSSVYAYVRGGIPVVLTVELRDESTSPPRVLGQHAVAVTGYSLGKKLPTLCTGTGFKAEAARIDKLYVHDDQVGPFARMELLERGRLSTSWHGSAGAAPGRVFAKPDALFVPLYHKIRIPFGEVLDAVVWLDSVVESLRCAEKLPLAERVSWDVYLTTVNDFKGSILEADGIEPDRRKAILTQSMPRFMWRATGLCKGSGILDLLLDATEISQGDLFVLAVEYRLPVWTILKTIAQEPAFLDFLSSVPSPQILAWLRRRDSDLTAG